jgi:hypothetical protein
VDQPAAPCRTVDAKTPTVARAISADVCVSSHWDANNDLYGESCSPDSVNATDHQHRVPPTLTTQASSSTRDDRAGRQFRRCQPKHGKAPIGYRSRAFGYTGALYNAPTFVVCTTAQLTDPFGGSSTYTNSIHRLGCQVSTAAERTAARTSSKYEANGGVSRSLISTSSRTGLVPCERPLSTRSASRRPKASLDHRNIFSSARGQRLVAEWLTVNDGERRS